MILAFLVSPVLVYLFSNQKNYGEHKCNGYKSMVE